MEIFSIIVIDLQFNLIFLTKIMSSDTLIGSDFKKSQIEN
jgi:hypothetical protein